MRTVAAAAVRPPTWIARYVAGSERARVGPAVNRKIANSTSTVAMSNTRSSTTVAKVAGTLSFSLLASTYGRRNSPARAGRRKLAAKPMTVARNATENRVGPRPASKYCQRSARSA
jgi:hypothetical protein